NKYQYHLFAVKHQNNKRYHVYNHLLLLSNNLMEVYGKTINSYSQQLQQKYNEEISHSHQVKRYTILGLMILLFFVLIILVYYTRMSFYYEQKIEEANKANQRNLDF